MKTLLLLTAMWTANLLAETPSLNAMSFNASCGPVELRSNPAGWITLRFGDLSVESSTANPKASKVCLLQGNIIGIPGYQMRVRTARITAIASTPSSGFARIFAKFNNFTTTEIGTFGAGEKVELVGVPDDSPGRWSYCGGGSGLTVNLSLLALQSEKDPAPSSISLSGLAQDKIPAGLLVEFRPCQ